MCIRDSALIASLALRSSVAVALVASLALRSSVAVSLVALALRLSLIHIFLIKRFSFHAILRQILHLIIESFFMKRCV